MTIHVRTIGELGKGNLLTDSPAEVVEYLGVLLSSGSDVTIDVHLGTVIMPIDADHLAEMFHEAHERLAPKFDYKTRPDSATGWAAVPAANKALMTAVAAEILSVLTPRTRAQRAVIE